MSNCVLNLCIPLTMLPRCTICMFRAPHPFYRLWMAKRAECSIHRWHAKRVHIKETELILIVDLNDNVECFFFFVGVQMKLHTTTTTLRRKWITFLSILPISIARANKDMDITSYRWTRLNANFLCSAYFIALSIVCFVAEYDKINDDAAVDWFFFFQNDDKGSWIMSNWLQFI